MQATVKIIGFGFACLINKSGLQYSTLGIPINMDPIMLKKLKSRGKKARQLGYDQEADIWSLDIIFYEMLIGKSAFDAEDMEELVIKLKMVHIPFQRLYQKKFYHTFISWIKTICHIHNAHLIFCFM